VAVPRGEWRSVTLAARPSSVLGFESFADGLDFLSRAERYRVKIAGGEIIDNIIKHASPVLGFRLRARVRKARGTIALSFFFRAPGFAAFCAGSVEPEPLFDPKRRRWGGLGLVMCRNLARRISFRPGEAMDRIFLEFEAEG
jgi:hypothetical protein